MEYLRFCFIKLTALKCNLEYTTLLLSEDKLLCIIINLLV